MRDGFGAASLAPTVKANTSSDGEQVEILELMHAMEPQTFKKRKRSI